MRMTRQILGEANFADNMTSQVPLREKEIVCVIYVDKSCLEKSEEGNPSMATVLSRIDKIQLYDHAKSDVAR